MTKRCKFCGVSMADATIGEQPVWQCPVCGFVVEKEEQPEAASESESE